ncbi:MAG: hypothetical protein AAF151_12155 [Cyanobacteria bacterium J06656_5]
MKQEELAIALVNALMEYYRVSSVEQLIKRIATEFESSADEQGAPKDDSSWVMREMQLKLEKLLQNR